MNIINNNLFNGKTLNLFAILIVFCIIIVVYFASSLNNNQYVSRYFLNENNDNFTNTFNDIYFVGFENFTNECNYERLNKSSNYFYWL